MTTSTFRRPGRLILVAALGLCVALAGGLGLWFALKPGQGVDVCKELGEDTRVRSALGSGGTGDSDCSRLGEAVRKATVGSEPGAHSLRQAQAMKDVLVTLADVMGREEGTVDAEFALPMAQALADYMPDVYGVVAPGHMDYVRAFGDEKPPWTDDDGGAHVSVSSVSLLQVMRSLADTPTAYAELRDAATGYAATTFAEVPQGAAEWNFESPVQDAAYVLGVMDGVADDVRQDLGAGGWDAWSVDVFGRMTKGVVAPPVFEKDPAGYIGASWRKSLRAGGQKGMVSSFEAQSGDMVRIWSKAAGLDGGVRKSLLEVARDTSELGREGRARDGS